MTKKNMKSIVPTTSCPDSLPPHQNNPNALLVQKTQMGTTEAYLGSVSLAWVAERVGFAADLPPVPTAARPQNRQHLHQRRNHRQPLPTSLELGTASSPNRISCPTARSQIPAPPRRHQSRLGRQPPSQPMGRGRTSQTSRRRPNPHRYYPTTCPPQPPPPPSPSSP